MVVVIVLVFVVVKVHGSGSTQSKTRAHPRPGARVGLGGGATSPGVPQSVADTVGTGPGSTAPQVLKGQPKLTSAGTKPELLFIGGGVLPVLRGGALGDGGGA